MGKEWGLRSEKEDEYRRKLLLRARKGDENSQAELMEKYGMRVYSDIERAKMPTYYDSGRRGSAPSLISNRANSTPSQAKGKTRAQRQKPTKTTPKPMRKI